MRTEFTRLFEIIEHRDGIAISGPAMRAYEDQMRAAFEHGDGEHFDELADAAAAYVRYARDESLRLKELWLNLARFHLCRAMSAAVEMDAADG